MPHRCASCGAIHKDAKGLKNGCPVCGNAKFIFESSRKKEVEIERRNPENKPEPAHAKIDDSQIESIKILEPGRYDLNLVRLAESDDRVIRMGDSDLYRLDLHSMVRRAKKK